MRHSLLTLVMLLALAAPTRAQISIPHSFVAGTVADPDQVNAVNSALGSQALNRTGGTITGNILVDNGITIDGIDIGAMLGGTGTPTFSTLTTTGNATIGGTLGVTGLSTLGSLTVTAATSLNTATVSSTLGVTGATTLTGHLTTSSGMTVSGTGGSGGGRIVLSAAGGLALVGATGSIADFCVFDPAAAGCIVYVPTGTRNVTFDEDVLVEDDLTVTGDTNLTGALTVGGAMAVTGNTTVNSFTKGGTTAFIMQQTNFQALPCDNVSVSLGSTGLNTVFRFTIGSGASACLLGGLEAGVAGQLLLLINNTGQQITLIHESGAASANNRFALHGGVNANFLNNEILWVWYDTTVNRWRATARP